MEFDHVLETERDEAPTRCRSQDARTDGSPYIRRHEGALGDRRRQILELSQAIEA